MDNEVALKREPEPPSSGRWNPIAPVGKACNKKSRSVFNLELECVVRKILGYGWLMDVTLMNGQSATVATLCAPEKEQRAWAA